MNLTAPSPLAQQQQALLQALFAQPGSAAADVAQVALATLLNARNPKARTQSQRGLRAYQANGHASAEAALLAAYPVVAALLGAANFAPLARQLWHHFPPTCGDLAQWGNALPNFLQASHALAEAPYLADVARAEWALHRAASAPDAQPDLASFARLAHEPPEQLTLTLAPGTACADSRFPVVHLITAHQNAAPGQAPDLSASAQRLRHGVGEHALVWRQGLRPRIAAVTPAVLALIRQLQRGAPLPDALNAACPPQDPRADAFDFSVWLNAAVTDGLVIGVHNALESAQICSALP